MVLPKTANYSLKYVKPLNDLRIVSKYIHISFIKKAKKIEIKSY